MRSDQRNLGFRVGYCHVQLTGVDIYIKLLVTNSEERKIKSAYLPIRYDNMNLV